MTRIQTHFDKTQYVFSNNNEIISVYGLTQSQSTKLVKGGM